MWPAIAKCRTVHDILNYGTEEYAYISYIEQFFDRLPPLVSFIQGGGLTENPHKSHI
jgi:hypothetical protein